MTTHVDPGAQHAVYAPSSAHRWMVCTASAEGIAQLPPQEEGEAAIEGTEAHTEIERCLSGSLPVNVDHPAAYGVSLLLDYVRQLPPGKMFVEQRVILTGQIWGRLDVGHYSEADETVTIVDYKNGFVDVSVVANAQLRIYASALIMQHKLPAKHVRYVIVQPNSIVPGPRVKQWIESAADLEEFSVKAAAVPGGSKSFQAGEQCKYCPLFGMCPASQDVLLRVNVALASPPDTVPFAQRALFKAIEKPVTDWFKAADKAWTKDALTSAPPPGMKLVTATTRRDWVDPAAARAEIVAALGPDVLEPPTPAQAEKLGMDKAKVAELAAAPEGGPVLAFESDKRKPWAAKTAAAMFGSVVKP